MGTISQKLSYLAETKRRIRNEIILKNVNVPENTPFREYAQKIHDISSGVDQTKIVSLTFQPKTFNISGSVLYTLTTGNITEE